MQNSRQTFDLIGEPWVICQGTDTHTKTLPIMDVLQNAHQIRSIVGDVPTQTFAITRVLLAIIRRAVDWSDQPAERWTTIWENGALPPAEITNYLESVRHRFDLLHPTEPFYQVADLHTAKSEFRPLDLLLIDVPTGEKYFTTRAGAGTESLSLAEAARWLVHCQAYDISGIKSADPRDPRGKNGKGYPIGVAWCGQLGGVVFEGANLFETLMLNTVLADVGDEDEFATDIPVWEQPHPDCTARTKPTPFGPCDLLTWQSRRIRLLNNGERVENVLVANGDPLSSHNLFNVEHMSRWRYSEPQSKKFGDQRYLPAQWNPDRDMWRSIESLLADVPDVDLGKNRTKAPGTAHWIGYLMSEGYLDVDSFIRPHAYGLRYINQSSFIDAALDDELVMHLALLGKTSGARAIASRAVNSANDAVRHLGILARNLSKAAGGAGEGNRSDAETTAFAVLTTEYRPWLTTLREASDPVERETFWQNTVRRTVLRIAEELTNGAGYPAFIGRDVNGRWLDTATAEAIFRGGLRKALPYAYRANSTTESVAQ